MAILISALRTGVLAGILISTAWTGVIVVWEWLENPGGIFHDESGTAWHFVRDTAVSWWGPSLMITLPFAFLLALVWRLLHKR